ncbi:MULTISPECIES: hypothetical protein [unclassified Streptomyces]|uniref:hypothetical protein n=1 Tax=unclassified Streptomyces TaxID=2593676 RepID=UPI002E2D3E1E|nr:hypothetical protein [Streptomyces sp. NBC_00273]
MQFHGGRDEGAHALGDAVARAAGLRPRRVPPRARQPVDLIRAQRREGVVHRAEVVAVAEDVALRSRVGVVDVPYFHLGVLLLEPQDDLLQGPGVGPPPGEDDAAVLLGGVLLGPEDLLDDPLGDRTPERGVPVDGRRTVAAGGERRVQQQHALCDHRLEPLRRLDGLPLLQQRPDVGDGGLLGDAVLPHRRRLDDAADADDPPVGCRPGCAPT